MINHLLLVSLNFVQEWGLIRTWFVVGLMQAPFLYHELPSSYSRLTLWSSDGKDRLRTAVMEKTDSGPSRILFFFFSLFLTLFFAFPFINRKGEREGAYLSPIAPPPGSQMRSPQQLHHEEQVLPSPPPTFPFPFPSFPLYKTLSAVVSYSSFCSHETNRNGGRLDSGVVESESTWVSWLATPRFFEQCSEVISLFLPHLRNVEQT